MKSLFKQIAEISLAGVPNEVCGVVVDGQAIECENISSSPQESFVIGARDILKYDSNIIFHSHPHGQLGFSDHDLLVAENMDLVTILYVVEDDRIERWQPGTEIEVFRGISQ